MKLSRFISSKLGAFLIIIPFIKPASEITGKLNGFFNVWKIIAILLILCCCQQNKKMFSKKNPILMLLLVQIIYVLSTCINVGDIKSAVGQALSNIFICLYLIYLYSKNEFVAIRNFMYPTTFMAIITAITMFLYYPNGIYQVVGETYTETSNYLWGFDNTSGILFISTIFFLFVYSLYINTRHTYFLTIIIVSFFAAAFLLVDSKTSMFTILFMLLTYSLIIYLRIKGRILNPKMIFAAILVLFISTLAFNQYFTAGWEYLRKIGKYYSIKARFIFFANEFEYFFKSPLWGYGIEDKLVVIYKLGIDHPHNYFMDLLYRGGVLAVALTFGFFCKLVKGSRYKDVVSKVVALCLGCVLIATMFDFYNEKYLFYPHLTLTYLLLTDRKYVLNKKNVHSGIKLCSSLRN